MPRSSDKEVKCNVKMLDEEEAADTVFVLSASDCGRDLLRRVSDRLSIGPEIEYFGLWIPETEPKEWVHEDDVLGKRAKKKTGTATFEFGVKFYVNSPSKLVTEQTRYLFFLQIKEDMSNGNFVCDSPKAALQMCASATQALIGNFDPAQHGRGYIAELLLQPLQTYEQESEIKRLHQQLTGITPATAEEDYLKIACQQTHYGHDFYEAVDGKKRNIVVGVGEVGIITMDRRKIKLNQFTWPEIVHVLFNQKRKTFSVVVNSASGSEEKSSFRCPSSSIAEALWRSAVQRHTFFRRRRKPKEPKQSTIKRALGIAKSSPMAKAKVSSGTQHEIIRASIKRKNNSPAVSTNFRRLNYSYNSATNTPTIREQPELEAPATQGTPPLAKPTFEVDDAWDDSGDITAVGTTEEATLSAATNLDDDLPQQISATQDDDLPDGPGSGQDVSMMSESEGEPAPLEAKIIRPRMGAPPKLTYHPSPPVKAATPSPSRPAAAAPRVTNSTPHLRSLFPSSSIVQEAPSSLKFEAGDVLNIVAQEEDANFWEVQHLPTGTKGVVPSSMMASLSDATDVGRGYQTVLEFAADGHRPRPICLVGSLKDQILDHILVNEPDSFRAPITHTSRPQHTGEIAGLDFNFVTPSKMEALTTSGFFVESVHFDADTYSTSYTSIIQACSTGDKCIMDVNDNETIFRLMAAGLEPVVVLVLPTDTQDAASSRMSTSSTPATQSESSIHKKVSIDGVMSLSDHIAKAHSRKSSLELDEQGNIMKSSNDADNDQTSPSAGGGLSRPVSMHEEMAAKLKKRREGVNQKFDDRGNLVTGDENEDASHGSAMDRIIQKRTGDANGGKSKSEDTLSGLNDESETDPAVAPLSPEAQEALNLCALYGSLPCVTVFSDDVNAATQQVLTAIDDALAKPYWAIEKVRETESDDAGLKMVVLERGLRGYGFTVSSIGHTVASLSPGGVASMDGGMQIGDRIIAVDRIPTESMGYSDLIATMKGAQKLELLLLSTVSPPDDDDLPSGPTGVGAALTKPGLAPSGLGKRPGPPPPKNRANLSAKTGGIRPPEDDLPSPPGAPTAVDHVARARQGALDAANAFLAAPAALLAPSGEGEADVSVVEPTTSQDSVGTGLTVPPVVNAIGKCKQGKNVGKQGIEALAMRYQMQKTTSKQVILTRTPGQSLGFSFGGGSDEPVLSGDQSFYLTTIAGNSPAEMCRELEIGDRVVEINGQRLLGGPHSAFVNAIGLNAAEAVLTIERPVGPTHTVAIPPVGGKFGLSITGGVETGAPPQISYISETSSANNTPLKVGMALTHINGHSVANSSHDDVMHMISLTIGTLQLTTEQALGPPTSTSGPTSPAASPPASGSSASSTPEVVMRPPKTNLGKHNLAKLVRQYYGAVVTATETISFDREMGESLGFTFGGGSDKPVVDGDDNVYISVIVPGGRADKDGRLRVGDRLLAANGTPLKSVTHTTVAHILRSKKTTVELSVCRPAEASAEDRSSPQARPLSTYSVVSLAARDDKHAEHDEIVMRYYGVLTTTEEIQYDRKPGESLGFSFGGGVDKPMQPGDTNVYITKIVAGGAAAADGRLKRGDRVLAANGTPLVSMDHGSIVRVLKQNHTGIKLRICRPTGGAVDDTLSDAPVPVAEKIAATPSPPPMQQLEQTPPASPPASTSQMPQTTISIDPINGQFGMSLSGGIDTDQRVTVLTVSPGGAASTTALTAGMEVTHINGHAIGSFTHDETMNLIASTVGSLSVTVIGEIPAAEPAAPYTAVDEIDGIPVDTPPHYSVEEVPSEPSAVQLLPAPVTAAPSGPRQTNSFKKKMTKKAELMALVKMFHGARTDNEKISFDRKQGESLGFSFSGGADKAIVPGDDNVYVTIITEGGVADRDGRLRIGDRILRANGTAFKGVTHATAVRVLKAQQTTVALEICRPGNQIAPAHDGHQGIEAAAPRPQSGIFERARAATISEREAIVDNYQGALTVVDTIEFSRKLGESLGFSFGGGSDKPISPGDTGIYITKIIAGGVADRDGRLKLGDRVLSANNTKLENVQHMTVVSVLKADRTNVKLSVARPDHGRPVASPTPVEASASEAKVEVTAAVEPTQESQQPVRRSSFSAATEDGAEISSQVDAAHSEASNDGALPRIAVPDNSFAASDGDYIIEYSRAFGESLGFSFAGGTDNPMHPGDTSIYITKIIPGGAADKDGRLQFNDRVVDANGVRLDNMDHKAVVQVLKSNQTTVRLRIARPEPEGTLPAASSEIGREISDEIATMRAATVSNREAIVDNYHQGALTDVEMIEFSRNVGESLGFSFGGGSDKPISPGDTSVYITKIIPGSAADKDGRLKLGDRMLEANGNKLESVRHMTVVGVLKADRTHCSLKVCRPAAQEEEAAVSAEVEEAAAAVPGATADDANASPAVPSPKRKLGGGISLKKKTSKKAELVALVKQFHGAPTVVQTVEFSRQPGQSLGFSFSGGADKAIVADDDNVYVTAIVTDSVADADGRLRVGDRLMEANGFAFKAASHATVVQVLKSQDTYVSLKICRPAGELEGENGATPAPAVIAPLVEATTSATGESSLVQEIQFAKGKGGLGMSLAGGADEQVTAGDSALYITRIVPGGSAAMDGRLVLGDKVIEANGVRFDNVTHDQAIDVLRSNGGGVQLKVVRQCTRVMLTPIDGRFGLGFTGGRDTGTPVVVSAVAPGSAAEASGLRIGQEMTFINGQALKRLDHDSVMELIKGAQGPLEILIVGVDPNASVDIQSSEQEQEQEPTAAGELAGSIVKGDYRSVNVVFDDFDREYHCAASILPQNTERNRYIDIIPYDHTRVTLSGDEDYINANYIQYVDQGIRMDYIATQGPLENTSGDFWQMVWEQGVHIIGMMTAVYEKRPKCHKYWPDHDQSVEYGSGAGTFLIHNIGEDDQQGYIIRTLRLSCAEGERDVYHCHFEAWPDHGVPEEPSDFVRYLTHVEAIKNDMAELPPTVLHCSAGIGRTGVFMLTETSLALIQNQGEANLAEIVTKFREQRMRIVQTESQFDFVHDTLQGMISQGGLDAPTVIFGQG
jgi:tyrosine-protein phosphatase non-receptor type 4